MGKTFNNLMIVIGSLGAFLWLPIQQTYFKDMSFEKTFILFLILQLTWVMGKLLNVEKEVEELKGK